MGAVDNVFFSTAAEAYLHLNSILLHVTNISVCVKSFSHILCDFWGIWLISWDDTRGLKRKEKSIALVSVEATVGGEVLILRGAAHWSDSAVYRPGKNFIQ